MMKKHATKLPIYGSADDLGDLIEMLSEFAEEYSYEAEWAVRGKSILLTTEDGEQLVIAKLIDDDSDTGLSE